MHLEKRRVTAPKKRRISSPEEAGESLHTLFRSHSKIKAPINKDGPDINSREYVFILHREVKLRFSSSSVQILNLNNLINDSQLIGVKCPKDPR